jgi:hypothetical protein
MFAVWLTQVLEEQVANLLYFHLINCYLREFRSFFLGGF